MSEGLSIGKALAEQGKGYYEEMKVRPDCVLLRPVPGRTQRPQSRVSRVPH